MKNLMLALPVALLLLCCTSCFATRNFDSTEDNNNDTYTETLQSGLPSAGDAQTSDKYNTIDEVDKAKLDELEADAISAMQLSQKVYASADKGTSINVILSKETVEEIVSAMGTGGYSVIDYEGNQNMQNPDVLTAFGEAVNAGQDAQASYFTVHSDGRVIDNVVSYASGQGTFITISLEWNEKTGPVVYSVGQYALSDIKYTDKGWLILNRDISNFHINKKFNVDSHTLVRISPYDDICREFCQKYLEPVGYSENNLFTSTWSENNYDKLDFNSLYPILYGLYYDTDLLSFYSANGKYELISGTNMHLVHKAEFEQVIGNFFNVSLDELRNFADYSESREGYFMLGYQTGYYNVAPRLPSPEVVDYWYNSDGTLTLKVDAVFPWYGTDRAFTHELTIRNIGSGFQYVSNYLYGNEGNILPDCKLPLERELEVNDLEK